MRRAPRHNVGYVRIQDRRPGRFDGAGSARLPATRKESAMTPAMRQVAALLVAVCLVGALAGGLGTAGAQVPAVAHPAHIHTGTCAELGGIAYPLSDVALAPGTAGTPLASPAAAGAAAALPVATSVTTVDVKLADLLAAPHAINVHQSAKAIEDYIACGDIGGQPVGGDLTIGLRLLGTYGYAGIAILHAAGDRTTVTLDLVEGPALPPPAPAAAAATPTAVAGTVAVTETEMQITASQTSFKVGQPYTFEVRNAGMIEHELVIEKRGDVDRPLEQAGQEAEAPDIEPGQTKTLTWTFDAPGNYQLACHLPGHFEAGMVLAIEVTA
jgi:uncharacterized cupredoxin-like copper-binding protein